MTREEIIDGLYRGDSKAIKEAIKALEQPCENEIIVTKAVSKKEVLDLVRDAGKFSLCALIEDLPSVTPTQSWIPASEKLPNDRDWYLGIFKEPDTGWINPLPFICDYVGSETKATTKEYWILHGFTDMDEHIDYYFNLECVAWMPLPKPYEEESEE